MNKKILLLLSNLRGIDGIIRSFQTAFSEFQTIPILFVEKGNVEDCPLNYLRVESSTLKNFTKGFDFSDIHAIFVSFMTDDKVYFVKHAPESVKLIWSIPGGDLYNRYLRYFGYSLVYRENKSFKYIGGLLIRKISRRKEFIYLINRCSAIVSAKCDYDLIVKYSPANTHLPIHIYAIAYPMNKMMGDLYGKPFVNQTDILVVVGNSISRTNNHLYSLKYLNSIDSETAKFLLLMSYGDSDEKYKAKVKAAYRMSMGNRVRFVTDYVSLNEFNRMLLSATHFVYGNWRQEAVGNILTAFYLGAKVYLSIHNPLLEYFRSKGFIFFPLEMIDNSFFIPLSTEDKIHNRRLIDELYNEKRAFSLFKEGLAPILY